MDRRSLFSAATATAAAAVAGCLDGGDSSGDDEQYHLEVTVQNEHDRTYDARVTVTDADDEAVLDRSFTLGAGEGRGFTDDYPAGEYAVVVDFADRGALQSRWDTDQCDVHLVRARIDRDGHLSNEVACTDRTPTTG